MEPPSRLEFSNSSGGWLDCSASGSPQPSIDWLSIDGTSIGDVGGIRRVLRNGTLVLLPFPAAAYRQDIHSTIYRCVATNRVGRIISRDVQVRAGKYKSFLLLLFISPWKFISSTIKLYSFIHSQQNPLQQTFSGLSTLSTCFLFLRRSPVFLIFHSFPSPIHFRECIDVEVNNHRIIKTLEYHKITSQST